MTALNLNQIIFLMVKVVQICIFIKQKASQCLKADYVKASQTSALKVSLHRAVLVSFDSMF